MWFEGKEKIIDTMYLMKLGYDEAGISGVVA